MAEAGSLLVEAEPVGDRGSFPAAGHPELGSDLNWGSRG